MTCDSSLLHSITPFLNGSHQVIHLIFLGVCKFFFIRLGKFGNSRMSTRIQNVGVTPLGRKPTWKTGQALLLLLLICFSSEPYLY